MRTSGGRRSRRFRLEQLEPRVLLAADLYISEFVAANDSTLLDEDGDAPDWIEIYNPGPTDASLAGWYLTDDAAELRKWSFPAAELNAGNFLVVFASDKDRSALDAPLHANFKLTARGEYLALTRDSSQPNDIEIVSEFTPDYPAQFPDMSYGIAQNVTINALFAADDDARVLFPTDASLGSAWKDLNFDDSGWNRSTAGIGYQLTVPGFTVEDAKSSSNLLNLTEAIAVLDGNGQTSHTTAITQFVNFVDSEGGGGVGNFSNDLAFPNDTSADDNDFAIRATGTITVPTAGDWTFGINSDDGARLRVDGRNVINDDTLHAPRSIFRRTFLTAGKHDLELVFFERGGGAEVELFAAPGNYSAFNSTFRLVGDVVAGGLAVETSPTGDATGFGALVGTDVTSAMYGRSSSAYLRVPFSVVNPHALDSLALRVNYDDAFVAYLNGTEVARRNAPPSLVYNSVAATDRLRSAAEFVEAIDISNFIGLLNAGSNNALAIHGLNEAIDSEEFLLRAELAEIEVNTGDAFYFPKPTPHDFNPSSGVEGFLTDEIILSHPHGFYSDAFSLKLDAATAGTTIRYTVDGSAPTETNGTRYVSPITVNKTTTVRARAFKNGVDPSFIETATYIFLADVLAQSPTGTPPANFPRSKSINGQTLDYGMDPAIVNDRTWGPQLHDALTQVPSMSIVMDIDDLLGAQSGIYTHARSHGKAWERPASLELIRPDGSEGFQVETGIRIRGGFSRSGNNPKHAFRLFFREEYGDAKLEFPLFGDEGADEFDKIDLRTTQNYSWAFQGSGENAFVRDIFSRDVHRAMGQPYTRSRYYHLYLNGQYWGLYQTQERAEARHAATYFGGDAEDYDVIKSAGSSGGYENEATDGNMDAYQRLADFFYQAGGLGDGRSPDYYRVQGLNPDGSENPNYEKLLDVDNLIDYMIIAYYTGDRDAPVSRFAPEKVNNYFAIFNRKDPDGFKFFEHDSEHTLDRGLNNLVSQITSSGREYRFFNPLWMHEQLAASNREYRIRFADAVYEHFANDGILTDANAKALIDARTAEFDQAIIAESARWGDAKTSTPFDKDDWQGAVSRVKRFLNNRANTVIDQFRAQGWYPDTNPPQFQVEGSGQHGGEVLATDDITLFTTDSLDFDPIVNTGSTWRYLDSGSNLGTSWRTSFFSDGSWSSGRAQLGYGDGDESTRVGFGSNSNNKHVTTYFRKSFNVSDAGKFQTLKLRVMRDDGAVVYLNGREVVRSNMPSGTISYNTFAAGVIGGGDESSFNEFELDASLLVSGNNVLAVEIHQANATSSDISFDLELLGGQTTAGDAAIYYTVDGSDPRSPEAAPSAHALFYTGQPLNVLTTTEIKARSFKLNEWSAIAAATFTVTIDDQIDAIAGDLNQDHVVDFDDIDLLVVGINDGNAGPDYDLDGNTIVDAEDLTHIIETLLDTRSGDANLDGRVNFLDFLRLSGNFGKDSATWGDGNFDLDGQVAFDDFLQLATHFGFESNVIRRGSQAIAAALAATDETMPGPVLEALPVSTRQFDDLGQSRESAPILTRNNTEVIDLAFAEPADLDGVIPLIDPFADGL